MAKTVLATALAFALMMASAHAQGVGGLGGGMGGGGGGRHQHSGKTAKTSKPEPKADDKAYNAALKSIPDKPFDTWSGIR